MPDVFWSTETDWKNTTSQTFLTVDGDNFVLGRNFWSDNFSTFESFIWNLYGQAAHDSTNEEIELCTTGTGAIFYDNGEDGEDWYAEADFDYSGAGSVWLSMYADETKINSSTSLPDVGYHVHFDVSGGQILMEESTGDSTARTTLDSMNFSYPTAPFTAKVESDANDRIVVSIDGSPEFVYQLSNPDKSLTGLGWTANSTANDYRHSLDNAYVQPTDYLNDGDMTTDAKQG